MSDAGSVKTGGQYPLAPPPLRKLTERTQTALLSGGKEIDNDGPGRGAEAEDYPVGGK